MLDGVSCCTYSNSTIVRNEQLDWELYRTFLAVVDAGSQIGAARQLRLSHPTVGRKITALEESLGTTLFTRSRDGLMLTAQGQRIREHAQAMAAAAMRAEAAVVTGPNARGNVKLSIGPTLAAFWLMPRIVTFLKNHPNIELELITHPYPVSVRRREADIVLRIHDSGDENLLGGKIAKLAAGFYASRDYAALYPLPERRDEWKSHSVIGFSDQSTNPELGRWSDRVTSQAKVAIRCSSQGDMLSAARAGLGICALTCFVGNAHADLLRVASSKLTSVSDIWLLTHPDLAHSPAIRVVLDFVKATARADRDMLRGE